MGYKRGKRGREAPKSLLEEEVIEASANIGAQESVCVCVLRVSLSVFSDPPWEGARLLLL